MLTDSAKRQLEEQGFVVLPNFLTEEQLEKFRARVDELYEEEGENAGSEFKTEPGARRLANCVDKGEIFEKVIETPEVLECIEAVLGPDFKLSSLNVRSASPNSNSGQPLHVDSGELPDERGNTVCNSVWMLDDFTEHNGALRIVPGSHKWFRLPSAGEKVKGEMLVTGTAGTVVVMNAHAWHGGTDNRTGRERRAMHVYYTRGDKPQQQYQKKWVRAEVQARLTPLGRRLLALDDPRNDELCAVGSGKSGFMK
jgi:ectoine hydroxylase-related dioxygenase (phytanoyl-CoA dioxygenase family)